LQTRTVLRADVFARLRAGDQSARREVIGAIQGGVRLLLSRRLDGLELRDAINEVHRHLVRAIVDGIIATPEELPAIARTIVQLQTATRTVRPSAPDPQAVKNLREAMSAEQLEILHRYYVLGESTDRISAVTGLTAAAIREVKKGARQVFRTPPVADMSALVPSCCVA
jgi:hypothetical protein